MLSYQACVDIRGSQSHTEHASCTAEWKEGSTYYFVARMNSSHVSEKDPEASFRCFVYRAIHAGYLVSQSAEAKCNLHSATEGYRTMELRRGESFPFLQFNICERPSILLGFCSTVSLYFAIYIANNHAAICVWFAVKESEKPCHFPPWFASKPHYKVLGEAGDGARVEAGQQLLTVSGSRLQCLAVREETAHTALLVTQAVHQCRSAISLSNKNKNKYLFREAAFHCLRLSRRADGVVSLQVGRGSPSSQDACEARLFFGADTPVRTLTGLPGTGWAPLYSCLLCSPAAGQCPLSSARKLPAEQQQRGQDRGRGRGRVWRGGAGCRLSGPPRHAGARV